MVRVYTLRVIAPVAHQVFVRFLIKYGSPFSMHGIGDTVGVSNAPTA
jgi:hypothetical protein